MTEGERISFLPTAVGPVDAICSVGSAYHKRVATDWFSGYRPSH